MTWWIIVLIVLGIYVLAAGIPWLVTLVLQWLLQRKGAFLGAEAEALQRLEQGLAQQRAIWPAMPRMGRYREPDQKALDRLQDLATAINDIDQLWPDLDLWAPASLSPIGVLTLQAFPAMVAAVRAGRGRARVRELLRVAQAQLEDLVLLNGVVADIPSAVAELAQQRAQQAKLALDKIRLEQAAGTLGLDNLSDQAAALQAQVAQISQSLCGGAPSDEQLLQADRELERIGAASEALAAQIEVVSEHRSTAGALVGDCEAQVVAVKQHWGQLQQQGAIDSEVDQDIANAEAATQVLKSDLEARTAESYSKAVEDGQKLKEELVRLSRQLKLFEDAIRQANAGVANDMAAIESARQALVALEQRSVALEADASLALVEQAAESFRQAEEQLRVGTLTAFQEAATAAGTARSVLEEAQRRGEEAVRLAGEAETLLDAVSCDRRSALKARLDDLTAELSTYAFTWRDRIAAVAASAGEDLRQAEETLGQLPAEVTSRRRLLQTTLAKTVEELRGVQALVASAQARIGEVAELRERLLRQRQELEAGEHALQERVTELSALREQMLPETAEGLDKLVKRLGEESRAMLDPAQVDYDLALANWLPSLDDELTAVSRRHEQDVKRLRRALKEWRGRLDRDWRRLQSMLDRDPRRPAEDVDQLYQEFDAWWERGESVADQAATMAELVDVQAPALAERIQRAVEQLDEGRRRNRDLARDLARKRRDLDRARDSVTKRGTESGWPRLGWDVREADDLWRQVGEAEAASISAPTIEQANRELERANALAEEAIEAYSREQAAARDALAKLNKAYEDSARDFEAATSRAAELRAQGPSPELTLLEEQLDSARRHLDAAREATSIPEAMDCLRMAQDAARLGSS